MIRVYVNGRVTGPEDAKVSVFDRGFLYGDSVYEVLRTVRGEPMDLVSHLERLARSAELIAIAMPASRARLEEVVRETLAAARNAESYVRIVVTRGRGEIDLDPAAARGGTLIVLVKPMKLPPPELFERGASVRVVHVPRNLREAVDPSVKSGNYLNNILALHEARIGGAYEAVMCDADGTIAEGASSNIFIVSAGVVLTPPLEVGLLEGITRRTVLELCGRAGVPTGEARVSPQEFRNADEAFLTSSVRGVMPITRIDDRAVGDGLPGPVTKKIMALYQERLS